MTDWFDDPEDGRSSWATDETWMRLYIVAGLIGMEALGVIVGMLHVLPA